MATKTEKEDVYIKMENIITEKVFKLEQENTQLKEELNIAKAKLSVYEKIINISDSKMTLGFNP